MFWTLEEGFASGYLSIDWLSLDLCNIYGSTINISVLLGNSPESEEFPNMSGHVDKVP
jgi:hypothetical protein